MSKRWYHRTIAGTLAAGMIVAGGLGAGTASAAPSVNIVPVTWTVDSKGLADLLSQYKDISLEQLLSSQGQWSNSPYSIQFPGFSFTLPDNTVDTGTGQQQNNDSGTETTDNTTAPAMPSADSTPAAPSAPSTDTDAAGQNSGASTEQSQFTAEVVKLVNQERAKSGLQPLTSDDALAKVALAKAKDMANNNYFSHTSPTYGSPFDMMSQYGIQYSYAGENIASGQQTPAQVMQDWMNSQGHRENIMNANFTKIGVGYYNGRWVQMFIG